MHLAKRVAVVTILLIMFSSAFSLFGMQAVHVSANSNSLDRAINLVFTVDPTGLITIDGTANDTSVTTTTSSMNLTLYGDLSVAESEVTTNITLLLPMENATQFPFNSTTVSLEMDYADSLLATDFNFTINLPSKAGLSEYISDADTLDMLEYFLNSSDFTLDAQYKDGDVTFDLHQIMVANLTNLIGSVMEVTLGLEAPFTLDLNYTKGDYDGIVRAYLMPGLPVSDFEMDLIGNLTAVCFNGTGAVTYGTYFETEINSTMLDEVKTYAETIFNASISQEGSLLNMTDGAMECTYVSVEITPVDENGAIVTYRVCVSANDGLIWVALPEPMSSDLEMMWLYLALNNMLYEIQDAEVQLVYTPADTNLDVKMNGTLHLQALLQQLLDPMPIPGAWKGGGAPSELNSTNLSLPWLAMEMLNATFYAAEDASLYIEYGHDDRTAKMNVSTLINVEDLSEDLFALLAELTPEQAAQLGLPPEAIELFQALATIQLANINTLHASSTYMNGEANLLVTQTFEGDINEELNYLKSDIITYLTETASDGQTWQMLYLNNTMIDFTRLSAQVTMDNVSTDMEFSSLAVKPPTDPINASAFTLDRFFNLTADTPFPAQGEQLNVTIDGGRNATHLVTIHNVTGIPEPDRIVVDSEGRATRMAWNNVSLSDLRPLQFILDDRVLEAVTLNAPSDVTDTSMALNWSKNEDPDFVRYAIFQSSSQGVLGQSVANITNSDSLSYVIHDLSYGTTYYFTVRVVDRFSVTADSNQVSATTTVPFWTQPLFIAAIGGAIGVVAVSIFLVRRRSIGPVS